ncbi:PorP/SprF family type IX secretion system membrane protein [Aquimarina sp. D1M17]|uniref:PorP/SprF family type IX secretion system membrane protein n=1 Tax=Aquimarina acroporae TaxID=2937283 RepID=UPI0020BDEE99|nr:PorP/SprF family type IX secretion system membrane protein [Aquimarina acroporae]MCK8523863.1 PorP/SprF family type IX secretion system membrane protein [Aquimarina acroporae]
MKRVDIVIAIIMLIGNCFFVSAQQTPVFANYNYNTVIINPAHAGFDPSSEFTLSNRGYLNTVDGSPRNIGLLFNSPLKSEKMGFGAGVFSDQVGVTTNTNLFAAYSYKIFFDHNYNRARWWSYNPHVLSFGVTAGAMIYDENLLELGIPNDPNFAANINTVIPTVGLGFLYNRNHLYLGFSVPNLLGDSLSSEDNINIETPYYAYVGYRFFATRFEEILINPSILAKYVSGAPAQFDFNTMVSYKNKIEVGAGYRTNSSINLLAGVYLSDHLRVIYNYNQTVRNAPVNNTHGIILSYRLGDGFRNRGIASK